jgi:integrase
MTNRAASAEPKKDAAGRWGFVVDGGVDEDGKRQQVRRKGFKTKREAQEALDGVRGKARTASYVPPAKLSVKEYLTAWIAGLPATGLRASTVDGYRRNVLYVTPVLGGRRLDSLTPQDLNQLYAELLATGRRQKAGGLSARSVRYVHVVIHKAFSDAVDSGILARNPAEKAKPPSAKSTRAPEMTWWSPSELRTFLDKTAAEPLGPLFRLAAMTGMRRGEVCGVRWSDIDLNAASLRVRQQLLVVRSPGAPDGGLVFAETTKTDHGRRTISIDPTTVTTLKARKAEQAEHRLAVGSGWANERDLVFTEPDGRPLDPESVAQVFNRRVSRFGLPRIRFHDLRHTHCAFLIESGEQLLAITRRLGHSSVAFTQDKYGHLFPEADSDAASRVAAMVDGSGS